MISHFLKNRITAGISIGLMVSVLCGIGLATGSFSSLNNGFSNSLYTLNEPSKNIVIIGVDAKSTQGAPSGLGLFTDWSRENFTDLLNVLKSENPKTVTLDFVFKAPSNGVKNKQLLELEDAINKTPHDSQKLQAYNQFIQDYKGSLNNPIDNAFAEALNSFQNIILDAALNSDGSLTKALPKFSSKATFGVITTHADNEGVIRSTKPSSYVANENKNYDDVALSTVKRFLGKDNLNLPTDKNGQLILNYFGDPFSFEMISFVDVINKKFPQNYFKDKIVLVGTTSPKVVHDEYATPRSNTTLMPGIEIIANEIQMILDGKFLTNQSVWSTIITMAAISIGLAIALNYLGILFSILVTFAVFLLYILTAHLSYKNGLLVNMFYPFAAIILTYLTSWIYKYFIADKKKREIKSAFGHYVSGELVDQISKNPDLVKLGGEKKVVTVFFSDIKNSTELSEKTPIEMWVSQINEYFTVMENVVKKSGGTLDKYEGDAVMGFWNAPVSQIDHIFRAYACAVGMRKALVQLHAKWTQENKPLIEFRIGINTGEALVGNFGSADRFDFTVMGDTVNTASRLESSANKTYGTSTIVAGFESARADFSLPTGQAPASSPSTDLYTQGTHTSQSPQSMPTPSSISQNFLLRELDTVYLPGKKEPVKLFELIGLTSEATDATNTLIKTYADGLAAYRKKDFATAIKSFEFLANSATTSTDKPSQILLARCQKLQDGEKLAELDEQMIFRIQNK